MYVFLDDMRATPAGYARVYWPDEAIALLKTGKVELISLDYDLGDYERATGYDVLLWMQEAVTMSTFKPPEIHIHTADPSARIKMQMTAASIQQLAEASTG